MGALVWFRFRNATPTTMASQETKSKVKTPTSYLEVKNLSYRDLVVVCKFYNVDTSKIGRDALDILLCEALGISTTGSKLSNAIGPTLPHWHCLDQKEIDEFTSITPTHVHNLTNWSTDAKSLPEIDIGQVKKYLNFGNGKEFSKENLKNYKLTRSYSHLNSKHIHSVRLYDESTSFCIVKAQCLPSQSADNKRVKWLYVVLDKATGDPYGGFCVCTVGRTQVCSHIGALLFLLCEVVANGESSLPADHNYLKSCTDVLCEWTDPKAATVTPKNLTDVTLSHSDNRIKPTTTSYVPQVAPELSQTENYSRVLKLLYDVRNANEASSMPAIVKIVDLGRFRPHPLPPPVIQTNLPNICYDFDIPYTHEVSVNTHPLAIVDFPHRSFSSDTDLGFDLERERFMNSVAYTPQEIMHIEELTRSQSESVEWFDHRKGAITSSRAIKVMNFYKHSSSSSPKCILKDVFQLDPSQATLWKKVPSLSWGIKNEERALHAYLKDYRKDHNAVQLLRTGLFVHPKYPFIRASPDAIISCDCHGKRLIEVKCPYSLRNSDIQDSISEGKVDYISNGRLKVGHSRGYYEQIMVQEAVTSIHDAVLVVWTKRGYFSVDVPFAKDYWSTTILPCASKFFKEHIVPEILTNKISHDAKIPMCTIDDPCTSISSSSRASSSSASSSTSSCHVDEQDGEAEDSLDVNVFHDDTGDGEDDVEDDDTDDWILGCLDYCKDSKAPSYSKVGGQLIACDANIACSPNTWFHLFCEGHRRVPKSTDQKYACQKCRDLLPNKENVSSGFYT